MTGSGHFSVRSVSAFYFLFIFSFSAEALGVEWLGIGDAENCYEGAGSAYQIDPWLLYSIASQESDHDPLAVNSSNKNGTIDRGLMQVNSFWIDAIRDFGYSEDDLFDACVSIYVGAWILAQSIEQYGANWEAVGAYNAGTANTPAAKQGRGRYAKEVYSRYVDYITRYGVWTAAN